MKKLWRGLTSSVPAHVAVHQKCLPRKLTAAHPPHCCIPFASVSPPGTNQLKEDVACRVSRHPLKSMETLETVCTSKEAFLITMVSFFQQLYWGTRTLADFKRSGWRTLTSKYPVLWHFCHLRKFLPASSRSILCPEFFGSQAATEVFAFLELHINETTEYAESVGDLFHLAQCFWSSSRLLLMYQKFIPWYCWVVLINMDLQLFIYSPADKGLFPV